MGHFQVAKVGQSSTQINMYGSDQMIWPDVIGETIGAIEDAAFLTEEQKRDILYNNAARFLRLTDEEIAVHHGQ